MLGRLQACNVQRHGPEEATNMYAKTCALCWIKVEVSMPINHSHRQENVSDLGGFLSIIDLVLASLSDRRSTIH